MPHLNTAGDENNQGTALALENWAQGKKITVTASAARSAAFADCGGVEVKNLTDKRVWVRTDDGTAADNGQSRILESGETWVGFLQSADGTISLLGEASNTGSVYAMGLKGSY
jgi:hypothetical protein